MRFVAISTGNTHPLTTVLGPHCDTIDAGFWPGLAAIAGGRDDAHRDPADRLDAITERNVTRRKIRFPRVFGIRAVASAYRTIYRWRIRLAYRHILRELARDTSRTVLVFNGYLAPNALLALAAESLSMSRLFLENGFYPGTMQCDPQGINALSTLPRDAAFYDRLSDEDTGEGWPHAFETRHSKLKDGNAPHDPDDLPDRYVFVPFQVPSDMQILALSPWIGSMTDLYAEIVALADAFPSRHFVVKEHPSFPLSIQGTVPVHPHIRFANSAGTPRLIEGAEAVITVNSTVGLEALTLGRKVITLGEAHYNIAGLVLHAADRTSLHAAFAALDDWTPDEARRQRFIRFIYNRFLVPLARTAPGSEALGIIENRAAGRDTYMTLITAFASKPGAV